MEGGERNLVEMSRKRGGKTSAFVAMHGARCEDERSRDEAIDQGHERKGGIRPSRFTLQLQRKGFIKAASRLRGKGGESDSCNQKSAKAIIRGGGERVRARRRRSSPRTVANRENSSQVRGERGRIERLQWGGDDLYLMEHKAAKCV